MQNRDQEESKNKARAHSESLKSWLERFKEEISGAKFNYLTLLLFPPLKETRVCSFAWLYAIMKESLFLELGK